MTTTDHRPSPAGGVDLHGRENPPSAVCRQPSTCITCSDEVRRATVLSVDHAVFLAQASVEEGTVEVDISLVPGVEKGDVLLVHGGVALERESVPR